MNRWEMNTKLLEEMIERKGKEIEEEENKEKKELLYEDIIVLTWCLNMIERFYMFRNIMSNILNS